MEPLSYVCWSTTVRPTTQRIEGLTLHSKSNSKSKPKQQNRQEKNTRTKTKTIAVTVEIRGFFRFVVIFIFVCFVFLFLLGRFPVGLFLWRICFESAMFFNVFAQTIFFGSRWPWPHKSITPSNYSFHCRVSSSKPCEQNQFVTKLN